MAERGDLTRELTRLGQPSPAADRIAADRTRRRERLTWALLAVLIVAVAVVALFAFSGSDRRAGLGLATLHLTVLPPENAVLTSVSFRAGPAVVSPDGTRLAFTSRRGDDPILLWVRRLDEPRAHPLPGTEGATMPFWSPDGQYLGFFAGDQLKKMPAAGGPVFTLARAFDARGGTWNRDDVIVYSPGASVALFQISARGGKPEPATTLDASSGETTHRYPHFLPDGRHVVYLARTSGGGAGRDPAIYAGSLDGKTRKHLVTAASTVAYAGGHLFFVREGTLLAQPFDPNTLEVSGQPTPVAQHVLIDERFSRAVFSVSENGVLAYQTGSAEVISQLRRVDRTGATLALVGAPANYYEATAPSVSPDGRRIAVEILDPTSGRSAVWLLDVLSGARTRLTLGAADDQGAVWSPDGTRLATHRVTGGDNLFVRMLKGGERPLREGGLNGWPDDWSPDGRYILHRTPNTLADIGNIMAVSVDGNEAPVAVAASDAFERHAQFSPDGRWVAYTSDESGRSEIYVVAFREPGARWQLSTAGGEEPRWSPDGKTLFYFAPDNLLMAAQIVVDAEGLRAARVESLFKVQDAGGWSWRYDMFPDGTFVVRTPVAGSATSPISLVTDWRAVVAKR